MTDWLGPAEWTALWLSLKVAFWATLLSLPFGFAAAYALARGNFFGRQALNVLVHLPLVMPPVVTGYLLLLGFGRSGPLGELFEDLFGVIFAFRWTGAALAAAIMGFPLMVRAIRLSLEAIDTGIEEAAATLGSSKWKVLRTITLPLAWPGILAGAILGFAKGMGEFGATITFVSNIPGQTQTLALSIDTLLEIPGGEPLALRLALVSIAIAACALIVSEVLAQRVSKRRAL
ncbi:molybdate transport system permease protein [Octadecabacter temperatus]|uniref:Molybdenum transport system permease n=1 Tax=Octadecabacter temperatus TaxID=1458307 RepID=A0A0K0Y2Z8_9RHOB|nr:molybdate ABC transporter permease subunit [Octadecabacter temperatus]AKS45334.1 Molybdenum transport system permease protein ModB [Octadecabacter temperatus]SIN90735.1 molybdate transport system permease protein [Octadecabacter temperatus]